jgi:hypothetical protein
MSKLFLLVLSALAAQAQTPAVYATATYSNWKPGMAEKGRARHKEFVEKVAPARSENPNARGFLVLERVFPTSMEAGHDYIFVSFSRTPPTFSGQIASHVLKAFGQTSVQYRASLNEFRSAQKQEIWTDVYRHGSFTKGGMVRISYVDPPANKTLDFLDMTRTYESAIRAEIVKRGTYQAQQLFQLWSTAQEEPYNFVHLAACPDSSCFFKGLGNRIDLFRAAHPNDPNYSRYVERYNASSTIRKYAIYRINEVALR